MEIREIQISLMKDAACLGDYQLMTKTELANGYCDADDSNDQNLKSHYWSALLLRYWYKIFEWIKNSKSCHLPQEEFFHWLNNSLYDAFYYRSWRWEYNAVVKNGKFIEWKLDENGNKVLNEHYWKIDPNAPDKSINYFCAARRGKEYQALNKHKRKTNVLAYSFDQAYDENGDCATLSLGAYEETSNTSLVNLLVRKFIDQGRFVESLIIDGIANHESFKEIKTSHYETVVEINDLTGEEKEVTEKVYDYDCEFDKRKLVKHLNTINQEFMQNYFMSEYDISLDLSNKIFEKLKTLNNIKLYKYIEKTLLNLKQEPDLQNY